MTNKQEIFTNSNDFFVPKTKRAKSLLSKMKQFNKLAEFFNSEEAKNILENDFKVKKGDKFVECNKGVESDYIALNEMEIEYISKSAWNTEDESKVVGTAYLSSSFFNIKVDGEIGKNRQKYFKFHPTSKLNYCFDKDLEMKKIDNNFAPKKREKHINIDTAYQIAVNNKMKSGDLLHFKKYQILKEICSKYGIEIKIDCSQVYPSKKVFVNNITMKRKSGDELYQENLPLNVPCMLHDNRADKERVGRLKKEGYIEKMKTTKIRNEMNEWLSKNIKNHEFELNFSGNSLLLFNQISMSFWNVKSPGFKTGNSEKIKYYDN